jgi:CheY-like chemotaxis protein
MVADTGMGIKTEMLQRLFTPFDRLDAEKTGVDGTGLGLTVSKALMEAMRGSIRVKSEEGVGSVFMLSLPIAEDPVAAGEVIEVDLAGDCVAPEGPNYTVLYIEDNLANLRLVESILERRPGIRLVSAQEGLRGVELAETVRPDLTLLDFNLPDINGDEVLRRLKDNPNTQSRPVVMISADATQGQAQRMIDSGAVNYLTKPIEVTQFLQIVDETLLAA